MSDGGGLYALPLYYDVVNAPGTAAEVEALLRAARQAGARCAPGSLWLEPACGTGRYLRGLVRRGLRVRGYDPQPAMLAYAAARLGRLRPAGDAAGDHGAAWKLAEASFTTPAGDLRDLGPVDAAFCPVNSLRHLQSDGEVLAHLAQVAALLVPGGVYVVGLDLLHDADRPVDEDVWHGRRGRLEVTQVVQYLPPAPGTRRERVMVELVARRPGGREHRSLAYDLRTYTPRQWTDLVARSALRRVGVCDARGRPLAGTARLPYQLELLARR